MALQEWMLPLDGPWPDRLAVGRYVLLILDIGTTCRGPIRSYGGHYLEGRSELCLRIEE
jgi:hypothetical protein